MARILDTLLTMARTEHRDVSFAPVDLGAVARDRVTAWQEVARECGVELELRVGAVGVVGVVGESDAGAESGAVTTMTDRTAVESALDGVIDNALKFAPRGTTVEVAATRDAAGCVLSVRDHGPGLTADEITHVTDRFWRSARDQNVAGSGLGLAIAHDLLHALGGEVCVTAPEGGGLRVALHLPAEGERDAGAAGDCGESGGSGAVRAPRAAGAVTAVAEQP